MREFYPGKWYVCDRERMGIPMYDDKGDEPLVFDEDRAYELLQELNENKPTTKG